MIKINFIVYIITFLLLVTKAYSLSSSSYLMANSALLNYDYDSANNYFKNSNIISFNKSDLNKKLLAFINSFSINEASSIAREIIENDQTNEQAWLVYLADAKLKALNKPFDEFEELKDNEKMHLINTIFYKEKKLIEDNIIIANHIYEILSSVYLNKSEEYMNYDYLLFYISLSAQLNESFDEAYFSLGRIYQNLKKYNKAEVFYNRINQNHDLFLESRINIAKNKKYIKNKKSAESDFLLLMKNYPENEVLLSSLADFYRMNKEYKKAIKNYSKILSKSKIENQEKWLILYMRGICYERLNNWKLAEEDFMQSLEINPETPQVLNYLAYGWIERNIFLDKSLEMLKIANKKNPESHYILDSLAWAHYKKNNLEVASKLMEEVIDRAPDEAVSLDHLGDIYLAMGRKREALYMWRQALDLASPEDDILEEVKTKLKKYNAG